MFQNSFPLSLWSAWGISFSNIHCENMVKQLEVKLTKVGGPCDGVSLETLTDRPLWDPTVHHLGQASLPCAGFPLGCCLGVSVPLSYDPYLSLPQGSGLPCDVTSLLNLKKSCWFSSLFSFLLVRTEQQLPSSSHAGLETKTVYVFTLDVLHQGQHKWCRWNKKQNSSMAFVPLNPDFGSERDLGGHVIQAPHF